MNAVEGEIFSLTHRKGFPHAPTYFINNTKWRIEK